MAHVPLPRGLELPRRYRAVPSYLHVHDPDLRLRSSLERPGYFILERRVRRQPAVNLGMRLRSDAHVQAAHGYLHVATVHPSYLERPWRIVEQLKESGADLWAARQFGKSGADVIEDEEAYEAAWQEETRKRRRHEHYVAIAREGYDLLNRVAKTRISNVGLSGRTDDGYQNRNAASQQDHGVHGQSGG